MLKSMTGFGRGECGADDYVIKVQIKSVNHRYADFLIKTPRIYNFLEDKIRRFAADNISRGKVEISVGIEHINSADKEIDEDAITELAMSALSAAFDDFNVMRINEGARLGENLKCHLSDLLAEVEMIELRSPQCVEEYRERLRKKLEEVLGDRTVDETRVITEAAIFADKISVDEETVRLRSHICAFKENMTADVPIGKKLDFIVQEMNREANTTGSKCNDAETAAHVVEMKSIIEKIREQIQNIE
ncbi:MAG: YicC family protein [Clostridiales bacterium]|nr:YicC family protein [Clostridiales bacterium]